MQELRSVLEKHGFHFKKQFGQNFISDGNLLRSIVEASGITKDTTVVEIGCGAGTLTRALAEAAKRVYAFDIDRDLQPVLAETLAGLDNVEVIFRDFNKLNLKEFIPVLNHHTMERLYSRELCSVEMSFLMVFQSTIRKKAISIS